SERFDERLRFWEGLIALCRSRKTRHADRKPGSHHWLGGGSGKRGLGLNYTIVQDYGIVELYIDRGDAAKNKRIFDQLYANKTQIEESFGGPLQWDRLDDKRACRIKRVVDLGGYRSPQSEWPPIQTAMVDAMTKLEVAILPLIDSLNFS
ncbi:MAG: DUF4268 domain-containing protein, partial [Pirellula sp.]